MQLRPLSTRYRPLAWLLAAFLAISTLTRIVLLGAAGNGVPPNPGYWFDVFAIGLGFDLLTFVYFAWPLVLLLWVLPHRWFDARPGRWLLAATAWILLAILFFVAASEWTFWEEFQTRFNFIAVDYLVYTTEVIGNIRESYPVPAILAGLFVLTTATYWLGRRWVLPGQGGDDVRFAGRSLVTLGWLAFSVLGTWLVSADWKDQSRNEYVNELAGNGIYQFFAAYRSAGLDYERFYLSEPTRDAFVGLRPLLKTPDATFLSNDPLDITRRISAHRSMRRLNVVLISVESLSAEYSRTYGSTKNLTPELDKLSRDSLVFGNLYATGTRTVCSMPRATCPSSSTEATALSTT
jgi:phosphoglycerol transferase MdoB-like AlkP superfamily enzyme